MKIMKKIVSLMFGVILTLTLATTAFAAGTGSITIDNPQAGETYTAYKVLDATFNTDKTAYAYTIDSNSQWYTDISTYTPGLTLTQIGSSTKYNVAITKEFSAAAFAKYLKGKTAGKTGTALTVSGGKASVSGLDLGYYFVSGTNGALCNLTTTNPDSTIHDKNDVPFEKTDDKADVQIGETVNYTITGKVPDTTGFETYIYKITDTMSEGLTFKDDVNVTVGGTVLAADKYTLTSTATGFTLTIKVKELQKQVGAEIKVTYTATVNEKAVAVISKNSAKLEYSNDPTQDTIPTTTTPDEETVYSAKIVIDKHVEGAEAKKLAGAKFVLMNTAKNEYYKYDTVAKTVKWVTNKADATVVTTDANGAANFAGLKDGTYYLEETEAPAGFNLLKDPVEIVINGSTATPENVTSLTAIEKVPNRQGGMLPETGGMGTTIFYVLGAILVLGSSVILVSKKRACKTNK